jgi:hypothetical protein
VERAQEAHGRWSHTVVAHSGNRYRYAARRSRRTADPHVHAHVDACGRRTVQRHRTRQPAATDAHTRLRNASKDPHDPHTRLRTQHRCTGTRHARSRPLITVSFGSVTLGRR